MNYYSVSTLAARKFAVQNTHRFIGTRILSNRADVGLMVVGRAGEYPYFGAYKQVQIHAVSNVDIIATSNVDVIATLVPPPNTLGVDLPPLPQNPAIFTDIANTKEWLSSMKCELHNSLLQVSPIPTT